MIKMSLNSTYKLKLSLAFSLIISMLSFAQETAENIKQNTETALREKGTVNINQDEKLVKVLALKKEINRTQGSGNIYRIQIYSGSLSGAQNAIKSFRKDFPNITHISDWDYPNYKVYVGSYRTSIQADKMLIEIRKKYPIAFKFKPKG